MPDHNAVVEKAERDGKKGSGITQRALAGIFWMFSGTGLRFALETVVLVVLARLLTPKDFGVVAAAITVVRFSQIITQSGIGQAIVQRPELETRHLETGFTLSCITGLTVAGIISLGAPEIAGLFRMVELKSILPVISLVFPVQGISLVAESLLLREVKFRILAGIDVASYMFGYGIVGVVLACVGFGVWALVAAHLTQMGLKTILLLCSQSHSKRVRFERRSFKELMYFGGGFMAGRICNSLAGQGDYMVVARWLGAASLGIYQRAYQLMAMPANLFGMALDKVLFPVMAKLQHEQDQLKTAYRRGIVLISLVVLPISVVMYELAPEIVSVLFGPKWLEVVIPFKILGLGMLFRTSYKMSDSLARATGAVYRRAWRQGIYAALVFSGALVGCVWGLPGVAYGILVAIFVNFLFMAELSLKVTSMTWKEFLSAHMPAVGLSLIAWIVITGSSLILRRLNMPAPGVLVLPVMAFSLTLSLLLWLMPNRILGDEGVKILRMMMGSVPDKYNILRIIRISA